jgi:hypothetical protein
MAITKSDCLLVAAEAAPWSRLRACSHTLG